MTSPDLIPLARPAIPPEAHSILQAVIESGRLVQGELVANFEASLAEYLGASHAVAVSSGTAALHLTLLALEVGHGDDVVLPAFTFPATANVVEVVGARPVMVDIGFDDFCIDVEQLEQALTSRTRVVMPVHQFGQAADMSPLLEIATRHGLDVVEDSACGLGARYGGRMAGTLGDLGCFSFHPRKALTTGEGGLIVTKHAALAERLRRLRNHGISRDGGGIDFIVAGLNYRMTEIQAALGIPQVKLFPTTLERRRDQAARYFRALQGVEGLRLPRGLPGRDHSWQTYHVMLPKGVARDVLIGEMRERGVEVSYGATALHALSFYRERYELALNAFPRSLEAYRQGLALPIGAHLTAPDVQRVADCLRDVLGA